MRVYERSLGERGGSRTAVVQLIWHVPSQGHAGVNDCWSQQARFTQARLTCFQHFPWARL